MTADRPEGEVGGVVRNWRGQNSGVDRSHWQLGAEQRVPWNRQRGLMVDEGRGSDIDKPLCEEEGEIIDQLVLSIRPQN